MKSFKIIIYLLVPTTLLLACNNENTDNNQESSIENNENADNNQELSVENNKNADDSQELSAEEIVNNASQAHEEREDYFWHWIIEIEDGETHEYKRWLFHDEDGLEMERTERTIDDSPTEYIVTINSGTQQISYFEGDDVARVEERTESEADLELALQNIAERDDMELVGEEEVNGFNAYHITFDEEDILDYWFEKDGYQVVRKESSDEDAPNYVVENTIDFDQNPEYDESLFDTDSFIPEGVEIVE